MYELNASDLASKGKTIGKDVVQVYPLTFNQLMDLSESAETNDHLPFVLAIQESCGTDLDLCDFYLVAAIQRIISLPDMPIIMKWVCRENNLRIKITGEDSAQEIQEYLTEQGFVYEEHSGLWLKYRVSKAAYKEINVELTARYFDRVQGSWYTCQTENSQPLTVEHLLKFVRQYPDDLNLDVGFATPKAIDIADYNELAKNPRMKKLLPAVMWMAENYGSTLQARMKFLQDQPREVTFPIIQKALNYDRDYRAGLAKVITCPPCSCCGASTEPFTLSIGPKNFFVAN